jgi:hypothetical protein
VTIVLFGLGYFVSLYFLDPTLAAMICIGVAFCVFFFLLDKRAIAIRCPACDKYISTNTPWICGNKGCRNDQTDEFPFIHRCQHCGDSPKAYECHHCRDLIFFTDDQQEAGHAVCANDSFEPAKNKKRQKHQEFIEKRKEQIELKELLVQEADVVNELKRRRDAAKPSAERHKPPDEELGEFLKKSMGVEDAAKKWKAEVDEKFKDDPVEREKRHQMINDWVRRRMR